MLLLSRTTPYQPLVCTIITVCYLYHEYFCVPLALSPRVIVVTLCASHVILRFGSCRYLYFAVCSFCLTLHCIVLSLPSVDVSDDQRVSMTMDKLSVNFGVEILTLVKGYVSTEVDARLSFDTEATLARARNIISLYEAAGKLTAVTADILVRGAVVPEGVFVRFIVQVKNGPKRETITIGGTRMVLSAKYHPHDRING